MRTLCFVASVACALTMIGPASAGPISQARQKLSTANAASPIGPADMAVGTWVVSSVSFGAGGSAEIRLPDPALFDRLLNDVAGSGLPSLAPGPLSPEAIDNPVDPDPISDDLAAAKPFTPLAPLEVPEPGTLGLLALSLTIVMRRRRA